MAPGGGVVISFRYHVASLVAVLLALATGIVLGNGPLQDAGTTQPLASRADGADAARQAARLDAALSLDDAFAAAAAPGMVAGALRGHAVTVLALPGASPDTVQATADLVGTAGGTMVGTVVASSSLLDPGSRQLVDELGAQLARSAPDAEARTATTTDAYARAAALLAYAVATTRSGGSAVPRPAGGVLAGLTAAGLVSVPEPPSRRGDLVLVVTGPPQGDQESRRGAGAIVAALATELDRRTRGVVVAGPAAAGADQGVVAQLRTDPGAREVSTVDSVERAAGRAVAVLALAEQADGDAGAYGAVGQARAALP